MKISYKDIRLNLLTTDKENSSQKILVVFLHGFLGQADDWNFMMKISDEMFYPVAPDILGHGISDSPDNPDYYTEESLVEQLHTIIQSLGNSKVILCGYSMGGRLALCYAVRFPENVLGLILESSTPGIIENDLRKKRIRDDEQLAQKIETQGIESFIDYWMNLTLFETLKRKTGEEIVKIITQRKRNNPIGIKNLLRGFGTGRMTNHWINVERLTMKTLLITGDLDEKFSYLNSLLTRLLPDSNQVVFKDCGHNVHTENPEEFFDLVQSFLRTFNR